MYWTTRARGGRVGSVWLCGYTTLDGQTPILTPTGKYTL